jgi:hypothetical protein
MNARERDTKAFLQFVLATVLACFAGCLILGGLIYATGGYEVEESPVPEMSRVYDAR